jgi:hypothetical protein
MSEDIISLGFEDALKALDSASDLFKIDVFIPSKQRTLSFKEIDAKQQKSLLNVAIDDNVYGSDFNKAFFSILKSNILGEDSSIIDELNVADRSFIGISLRSQISPDINVKFTDEKSEKINLNDIISKFKTYKLPSSETLEIKNDNVTLSVNISLPTLRKELDYNEEFFKDYKKSSNNDDIKKVISEAFIGEISKYINSVKLNENTFNFETLSTNQKLRIVEKLPSGLIQKVLNKISDWKKDIDGILTVSSGENTKVISVDSLLFLS